MVYHVPALLNESIEGLNIKPDGIYVDATYGGGGHSAEILRRLKKGRLVAFDLDEDAAVNAKPDKKLLFLNQNFRFLRNNLRYYNIELIDGLIADLGVSFHQFDEPERGFTFRQNTLLDMRMNKAGKVKASDLLKTMDEDSLAKLFYEFGELTNARKIAAGIVSARRNKTLTTVNDMIEAVKKLTPYRQEHKFYARLFQALRIAVNQEDENLKELLGQALAVLKQGGRLVVITYHSLEDRMVKNFMRTGNFEGIEEKDFYGNLVTPFRLINKKVITPGEDEIAVNNRARSARLRIAEKI
jgi:16S rRNA (cytosine1402-N4)-methyltransferase